MIVALGGRGIGRGVHTSMNGLLLLCCLDQQSIKI